MSSASMPIVILAELMNRSLVLPYRQNTGTYWLQQQAQVRLTRVQLLLIEYATQ